MPQLFSTTLINSEYDNYLVLGDIHGNLNGFTKAVQKAKENNAFIISLGDIVDYGSYSAECFQIFKELYNDKHMTMILGNHDIKNLKYFTQERNNDIRVNVKRALKVSIDSFDKYDPALRSEYINVTSQITNGASLKMNNRNYVFIHGAVYPGYWDWISGNKILNSNTHEKKFHANLIKYATFGEVNKENRFREDGYPNRVYDWINDIPDNTTVMFGHDILNKEHPTIMGNAISMDCGSSKGGTLFGAWINNYDEISFEEF